MPAAFFLACHAPQVPAPVMRDVPYGPHSSQRYDVYSAEPKPEGLASLVVLIHGGGWASGARKDLVRVIPQFTARRCVVANIGYRVTSEAVAPAAAEDVRNAIEAVRALAGKVHADSRRTILVGYSAGAHLALLAALAPSTAIGGPQCRARGVVSFWGITDVEDLLGGAHARDFAKRWLPAGPGQLELARRLSPIRYDVTTAPALCAVHSVHDHVVPFSHSERLVAKFTNAKRPAKLIKLSHRGHGAPSGDYSAIFGEIFRFMDKIEITE